MSNIAYLLTIEITSDSIGNRIETETTRKKVFGKRKDVMSYEYYNALSANNMKLEFSFEMWKTQYNKEQYLEFDGEVYIIIRTLNIKKDKITLLLQKRVD